MNKNKGIGAFISEKRAQGISLNVIIIAAIALLVLVVLVSVFLQRIGIFAEGSGGTDYCVNQLKGECSQTIDGTADSDSISCPDETNKLGVCNKGEGNCCGSIG